ncbi:MAG: hypothetical protein U0270_04895 [Labilithrix sp.]
MSRWWFYAGILASLCPCACSASSKKAASPTASSSTEIVVLGVTHRLTPRFPPERLAEIVASQRPSMVLLELPIDWYENGHPTTRIRAMLEKDGQAPDGLAWSYCQHANIWCGPFDLRGRNEFYRATRFIEREDVFWPAVFDLVKERAPLAGRAIAMHFELKSACTDSAPEQMNSSACDGIVALEHSYRAEVAGALVPGSTMDDKGFLELSRKEWDDRNRAMAENVCAAARRSGPGTVVVIVGYEHRYALRPAIARECPELRLRELWEKR